MIMARVQSKNLFHYQLSGELDAEAVAVTENMKRHMSSNPEKKAMFDRVNSDDSSIDDTEVAHMLRSGMDDFTHRVDAAFKEFIDRCVHSEFRVPIRDGNDFKVPVLVHTPKELVDSTSKACVVFAHGGGVVAGDAAQERGPLSRIACESGVVCFNVDYRLAPETKCPWNVLDFYCAVKHVKENAEILGVDPQRIAIMGNSGGGYVCFGAMVMMAQKDETDLVKLSIPGVPLISDYCFGDLAEMTKEERESAHMIRRTWKCIAGDFDKQRNDPLLFPAKSSDEIIAKMPPTIIWEVEFDMFITSATRMANRMRRMGRLLELRVQPGMTHHSAYIPGTKGYDRNLSEYKVALENYLL